MTRFIYLKSGHEVIVDDKDYEWLSQYRWCYSKNGGYAVRYATMDGQRKMIYMHREIMSAPPHLQVDHKNRKRLDNRRSNLRFATKSQNQSNKGKAKNNTSGYKGVYWRKGKWEARIQHQGQRIVIGRTSSRDEAIMMYDIASRTLNKEFAGMNAPTLRPNYQTGAYVKGVLRGYKLQ